MTPVEQAWEDIKAGKDLTMEQFYLLLDEATEWPIPKISEMNDGEKVPADSEGSVTNGDAD